MSEVKFQKFAVSFQPNLWTDLNLDEDSLSPINANACWLIPQNENNDYLRRNTCILIKEFAPDIDVIAREKHNESVMEEVEERLEISVFEASNEDYLGFENSLKNIVYHHYHKKLMESGKTIFRAKYIIKKENYSLLVVIKFFDETSPDILKSINEVLTNIT
jgi:hypothetical protein